MFQKFDGRFKLKLKLALLPELMHLVIYRIFKTIILPVVLYGCETWSHTLREEFRLRVFGKKDPEPNIWVQEG